MACWLSVKNGVAWALDTRGELEYASGYEKMYGVTDEQLAFL